MNVLNSRTAEIFSRVLESTDQERRRVEEMLAASDADAPEFWRPGAAEEMLVPVSGALLRVLRVPPPRPAALRPIVLVPGWGAVAEGFQDFYRAIHGRAELYYLETREKSSSRILDRRAEMTVSRSARDIAEILDFLGFTGKSDFILMGACWGASIILQGVIDGTLDAPTILLADPMHTLWFPKWLLRYVEPLLPAGLIGAARRLIMNALVGNMREPTQKARAYAFAHGADPWKWKKSARAARDFELFGALSRVEKEIFVLNGTTDMIHDQTHYPRIAWELPRGRFLYMPTGEDTRERLFGTAALELARVGAADGLPASLARFEKNIRDGARLQEE